MNIYYNIQTGKLCNNKAGGINQLPVFYQGCQKLVKLQIFNGYVQADLSKVITWRADIVQDLNPDTATLARTLNDAIDASKQNIGLLAIPTDTDTEPFIELTDGVNSVSGWYELWGSNALGDVIFYVRFPVILSGSGDLSQGLPNPVPSDYITDTQARALWGSWQSYDACSVGDRRTYPGKSSYTLVCQTAGVTGAVLPEWPASISSGVTTLTDGTVTWIICDQLANTLNSVSSVNGQYGDVYITPASIQAAPQVHTHVVSDITDLSTVDLQLTMQDGSVKTLRLYGVEV